MGETWESSVPPQTPHLRDTQETRVVGSRVEVHCFWATGLNITKGQEWICHLSRQQQVHAVAVFRISFHKLNIEVQRPMVNSMGRRGIH